MTRYHSSLILVLGAVPCLAACATGSDLPARPLDAVNVCQSQPGQAFLGQTATAATGAALMSATHATEIRWVPPRTAVTMDLKYGRLTVGYDDAMVINSVACT